MQVTNNYYYNGSNYIYAANGAATRYHLVDGQHQWYTAPSGTAGNAITFTQAMTLDASGNLGIGTTSPSAKFHVAASGSDPILFANSGGGSYNSAIWQNNNSYKMAVGIGGGSVGGNLQDTGYIGTISNIPFTFQTNNTERARIDSSGNLLVGGTAVTNTAKLESFFNGSTTNGVISNDTASAASAVYFGCSLNGTLIGSVQRVGSTSAVIYNTTSDYRLKTVIGAVSGSGERIDALQPVEYTWKADGLQTRGFLAHQFQDVYANSVSGIKDAVDAEANPVYQSMQAGTSEVIADLVAELQSLRKRLAALEAK
jgi:hypothetical protein